MNTKPQTIEINGFTYCTARIGSGLETHVAALGLFPNPHIFCPAGAKSNGHSPKVHVNLVAVTCKDCLGSVADAIADAIEDAKWGIGGDWQPTGETIEQIVARDLKL